MSLIFDLVATVKDWVAQAVHFAINLVASVKDPAFRKYAVAVAGVVAIVVGWALGEDSPEYASVIAALTALGVRQTTNQ